MGFIMHHEHSELGKERVAFNVFVVVSLAAAAVKLKYCTGCAECEQNPLLQQWI